MPIVDSACDQESTICRTSSCSCGITRMRGSTCSTGKFLFSSFHLGAPQVSGREQLAVVNCGEAVRLHPLPVASREVVD